MEILQPPRASAPSKVAGWPVLALGFRPFFLLAGISAVLMMLAWILLWRGALAPPAYYDPVAWHGHEMLFGYTVAVVAGFLLTAVRNWTGVATWSGPRLGGLVMIWLLGRVLPWFPASPTWLLIGIDLVFLPLLTVGLAGPLWQARNRVNRVFILLPALMSLANLLSHLQLNGLAGGLGDARRVMLDLVLLLIVLVAGRVLPLFTRNVLPGFHPVSRRWVEKGSLLLAGLIAAAELFQLPSAFQAILWLVFAPLQLIRLHGWFERRVVRLPVLWVLHAGYAWLALGSLLRGLALLGLFAPSPALHALTTGVVGVFTLGMMARVARGHTGRPISVTRLTAAAFVLVNVGAFARVFGPALQPESLGLWVDLSAGLWILAFGLFVYRYAGLLLRPRVDGKPG